MFVYLFVYLRTCLLLSSVGSVCHPGLQECEADQHDNIMEERAWLPCHFTPLQARLAVSTLLEWGCVCAYVCVWGGGVGVLCVGVFCC